jgi:antitoxin CcdA
VLASIIYAHDIYIEFEIRLNMPNLTPTPPTVYRKRAVNIALSEGLVAEAGTYSNNLSAALEALLADYLATQQRARATCQQKADRCAAEWNAIHASIGSLADEHSTFL